MPAILERLARQLRSKGVSNSRAVATSQLQKHGIMKKGSTDLTTYGKTRNAMSPAERAKARAAKYSGKRKPSDYKYNKKTNRARVKKDAK